MNTAVATPQHMTALAKANEIRVGRAKLKREVGSFDVDLRELVAEPPEVLLTARVFDLVMWLPRVGPDRASKLLRGICGTTVTLGAVGPYTRGRIIAAIDLYMLGLRVRR